MSEPHGLSQKTVETICRVLAAHPEIERAVLFGSRAKGTYKTGSDIDLALSGVKLTRRTLNRIDEELDDAPIPYHVSLFLRGEVDAELLASIERVGIAFYAREVSAG